jgi:DNA-binding transcriptional regulator LsrR (DeoR family)
MKGRHRNHRGHVPALNTEARQALLRMYFRERKRQVTLAIHYRISQSTVARYIANG